MNKKKLLLSLGAVAIVLCSFTYKAFHGHEMIKLGAKAPMADEKMKDVSGDSFSLNDLKETNGLLVVFSCNTCPFVVGGVGDGWEGRYNDISQLSSESNIGMVLVNSNEAKREKGDSFNDMVERAKDKKFKSKYVIDNHSKLADAFGARTTPHVFLFDKNMELVYVGAIDDNVKAAKEVKETYLNDALTSLAKSEEITKKETRNIGCSIKRAAH